jgi:hypothetical protein
LKHDNEADGKKAGTKYPFPDVDAKIFKSRKWGKILEMRVKYFCVPRIDLLFPVESLYKDGSAYLPQ